MDKRNGKSINQDDVRKRYFSATKKNGIGTSRSWLSPKVSENPA